MEISKEPKTMNILDKRFMKDNKTKKESMDVDLFQAI